MTRMFRLNLVGVLLLATTAVQASFLFDGKAANLWLLEVETKDKEQVVKGVTSYSLLSEYWLDDFLNGGNPVYDLDANDVALVNSVANSSLQIGDYQPAISLMGLSEADHVLGQDSGQKTLQVYPASGDHDQTIEVAIEVDLSLMASENTVLQWVIKNEGTESIKLSELSINANGFAQHTINLVKDGTYDLTISVVDNNQILATEQRLYSLEFDPSKSTANLPPGTQSDGYFRRDSDGDGIPDIVEAEIGLDLFNSDLNYDSDGDGWSDFNIWLRSEQLDSNTGLPTDRDGDGWSDFDEALRGTEANAPNLDIGSGFSSIRDVPSARRLYEVEYKLETTNLPDDLQGGSWQQVLASDIYGNLLYASDSLLLDETIEAAGVNAGDVSTRVRKTYSKDQLSSDHSPIFRTTAGMSSVVNARYVKDGYEFDYKTWLDRRADLNPELFFSTVENPTWNTAQEWKTDYTKWLSEGLVISISPEFTDQRNHAVHFLEAMLSREATFNNLQGWLLFADSASPYDSADFIKRFETTLQDRFALGSLDQLMAEWLKQLPKSTYIKQIEDALVSHLKAWSQRIGQDEHARINRAHEAVDFFLTAYGEDKKSCLIDENGDQFNAEAECDHTYTVEDLDNLTAELRKRQYALRLYVMPQAWSLLSTDSFSHDLIDPTQDYDLDEISNGIEWNSLPIAYATSPLLKDSDGDAISDADDQCSLDIQNVCISGHVIPEVGLPTVSVSEPAGSDGFAIYAFALDERSELPVTVSYSITVDDEDTAEAGVDFKAVQGEVTIPAGKLVGFIRIPLLGDSDEEETETFRIVFEDITNGELAQGTSYVLVSLTDTPPVVTAPPVMVSENNLIVVENSTYVVLLEANDADSPTSDIHFVLTGMDADKFEVTNSQLSFKQAPDYEAPSCSGQTDEVRRICNLTITPNDGDNTGDEQQVTVTVIDDVSDNPKPIISIANATVAEGDSGQTEAQIVVTLSEFVNGVSVDYATSDGSAATADSDYVATSGTLNFSGGSVSETITIVVNGDEKVETDESLTVALSNPVNAELDNAASATLTITNDDVNYRALNDTGIMVGAADSSSLNSDCSGLEIEQQDCSLGRDALESTNDLIKIGSGQAGFDFTKLGQDGSELAIQNVAWSDAGSEAEGSQWSCVRDNNTGLIWEVKNDDSGLHDKDDSITWYNDNSSVNGGNSGSENGAQNRCFGYDVNDAASYCNTQAFVNRVNATGLCGLNNWRLPDRKEMNTIVHKGRDVPTIDTDFFPNSIWYNAETFTYEYWTSSVSASSSTYAMKVHFGQGNDLLTDKEESHRARLVSGNSISSSADVNRFVDHSDGTVTDTATGLMWHKCMFGQSGNDCSGDGALNSTWVNALSSADNADVAGYNDWRLPNVEELRSITVDGLSPTIDASVFPNTLAGAYWTSSPFYNEFLTSYTWIIEFTDGNANYISRIYPYVYIRLVRDVD